MRKFPNYCGPNISVILDTYSALLKEQPERRRQRDVPNMCVCVCVSRSLDVVTEDLLLVYT